MNALALGCILAQLLVGCSGKDDTNTQVEKKQSTTEVAVRTTAEPKMIPRALVESSSYFTDNGTWLPPRSRTVDYPSEGVNLGQGWDSLQERKTSAQCIEFASKVVGGQFASVETKRILESDTLRQSLNLSYSAAASAKFGIGGGEVSAKGSFLSSSEVNNQFLNLLVKGEVTNGVTFVAPPSTGNGTIELSAFAKNLLKGSNGVTNFLKYCGDSFVASIERGANLFALYQFSSKQRQQNDASAQSLSVSGSYLAFSASGSTSEESTRAVASTNQITGLKYFHNAHRGLRLPYDEASIGASLASLGSAPELEDAKPFRLQLTRYDSLPGWDPASALNSGPATREALVAFYIRLSDLRDVMKHVQRDPSQFYVDNPADVISVKTLASVLDKKLIEIDKILRLCETEKQAPSLDTEKRGSTIRLCTNRTRDIVFSDYPYRALMPIKKDRVVATPDNAKVIAEYDRQITALDARYKETRQFKIPFGSAMGTLNSTCNQNPLLADCPAIANAIASTKTAKDVAQGHFQNVAESRYKYWIESVARDREDAGLINGALSEPELAMFRREIYCQYGTSPDTAKCPTISLASMLLKGGVKKTRFAQLVDLTGESKTAPLDAWNNLHDKLIAKIDDLAGQRPHVFDESELTYTSVKNPGASSETAFNLKGTVTIEFFEQLPADDLEAILYGK
jgi:hypothetical protein